MFDTWHWGFMEGFVAFPITLYVMYRFGSVIAEDIKSFWNKNVQPKL